MAPSTTNRSPLFVDANILLEVVLGRRHDQLIQNFLTAQTADLCISTLTAHLLVHFGQPVVGLPVMRKFLGDYELLPLTAADFDWAFTYAQSADFEDALQLAVAIRHGCHEFITLDQQLTKHYSALPTIKVTCIKP